VRLAALLHDIGHGPLSHTTEFAMPDVRELKVPGHSPRQMSRVKARKADHEDYTLKILLDSGLTPLLAHAGATEGFNAWHVAALVDPSLGIPGGADFFTETIEGERVDFRPILKQLISSELDADRMDYLRRDSQSAGVSYGHFDFDWLVGSLTSRITNGKCYLALHHRALYSFEDFLISRFHMFLMVYFHYKSVVFDEMLGQYFASPDCDYRLPADIEKYCEHDDAHLYSHLARSRNEWARRITDRRPYRMLMELHSGIPATQTAAREQARLLASVRKNLEAQKIHYLMKTSTGELSKYFRNPAQAAAAPIFVRYDNHYSAPSFIPLEQCTDLFQRYSEKRTITRLYVSPENYPLCRNQGRGSPLRYEDPGPEPGQLGLGSVGPGDPGPVLADTV
jgi:HD superfamily phosphohydrolase